MVEAILEAAARVLIREGYARTTTNRIAAAAGISVGSLYQYFPGKDALVVALLRRHREGMVRVLASHLDDADRGGGARAGPCDAGGARRQPAAAPGHDRAGPAR
jgi:AcrR family transcriptional regulator